MTEERQLYYIDENGKYLPERRTARLCDRHGEVIEVLKDHGGRIKTLENQTVAHNERMVTIFNRLDKIDKGIEGLYSRLNSGMVAMLLLLAGFFVWYVQGIGG